MSGAALAKHRRIRRAVHLLMGSLAMLMIAVAITAAVRMAVHPALVRGTR